MTLYEIVNLYVSASSKVDNYWTIFIIITAAIIAVPLPKVNINAYLAVSGMVVIYAVFAFIDYWALDQVYKVLRLLAEEIKLRLEEGGFKNQELKMFFQNIPSVLLGSWHGITHAFFVIVVAIISYLKIGGAE